eukprot:12415083-Prorocentrum_lima.AAC.1
MTSSLVGSEMCIRDSRSSILVAHGTPSVVSSNLSRRGEATATRRARRPVSYTHLTLPTICSV